MKSVLFGLFPSSNSSFNYPGIPPPTSIMCHHISECDNTQSREILKSMKVRIGHWTGIYFCPCFEGVFSGSVVLTLTVILFSVLEARIYPANSNKGSLSEPYNYHYIASLRFFLKPLYSLYSLLLNHEKSHSLL